MLKFFRLFFVGAILVLLTACGGGSSSQEDSVNSGTIDPIANTIEDQEDTDSSADNYDQDIDDSLDEGVLEENNTNGNIGNEDCITVSRPIVGQTLRYGNPSPTDSSYYHTIQEWTIIEFSDTSSSVEKIMTGDFLNGVVNETITYNISNNYMDATKLTQENTFNSNTTTNTIEFSPFQRIEIDTVCLGQSWTSVFKLTVSTTANGVSNPPVAHDSTQHSTIESVNETKIVTAGIFSTYRKRLVDENGATVVWWIDVDTGAIVYFENYSSDGVLSGIMELLSIE